MNGGNEPRLRHGWTDHEMDLARIDGGRRAQLVQGLIDAAAFIAAHTDIPIPADAEIRFSVFAGDDAANHAQVDRIAVIAGEGAHETTDGIYEAARHFGPVSYRAVAIAAAQMDRWNALNSYSGSVTPETRTAA